MLMALAFYGYLHDYLQYYFCYELPLLLLSLGDVALDCRLVRWRGLRSVECCFVASSTGLIQGCILDEPDVVNF